MEIIFTRHIVSAELVSSKPARGYYVFDTRKVRIGSKFFGLIPIYAKMSGIFDEEPFSSGEYYGSIDEFNSAHPHFYFDQLKNRLYHKDHVKIVLRNGTTTDIYSRYPKVLENLFEKIKTEKFIELKRKIF